MLMGHPLHSESTDARESFDHGRGIALGTCRRTCDQAILLVCMNSAANLEI